MLEYFALCFAEFDGHVSNHWATHADPNRNDLSLLHLHKRRFDASIKTVSPPIHSVAAHDDLDALCVAYSYTPATAKPTTGRTICHAGR